MHGKCCETLYYNFTKNYMRKKTQAEERLLYNRGRYKEKALLLETHRAYVQIGMSSEAGFLTPEEEASLRKSLRLMFYDGYHRLLYAHYSYLPYRVHLQYASIKLLNSSNSIEGVIERVKAITALFRTEEIALSYMSKEQKPLFHAEYKEALNKVDKDYNFPSGSSPLTDKILAELNFIEREIGEFLEWAKYGKQLCDFTERYLQKHLPLKPYKEALRYFRKEMIETTEGTQKDLKKLSALLKEHSRSAFTSFPEWKDIGFDKVPEETIDTIAKSAV